MKIKRLGSFLLAIVCLLSVTSGCNADYATSMKTEEFTKMAMATDTGGVNDQSFNQSAWAGMTEFGKKYNVDVSYLESKQESDFEINLDKLADSGNNLVWGIGFAMAHALLDAAESNIDINYAIIDNSYGDETPENVTGVVFRAQESAFIVGYIAGKTTTTNKVGFVGGMKSDVIDQFHYGYMAGVDYAAKEVGKKIDVNVQYAESFSDSAKGKAIATKMFTDGCDIVFHAAGGVGVGVIEAAKSLNKFAIGVDLDQSYLAPDNVLTSALKNVNVAVIKVSEDLYNNINIGGKTYDLGLKDEAVGIPKEHKNMSEKTYNDAIELEQLVKEEKIIPPKNKEEYDNFINFTLPSLDTNRANLSEVVE